MTLRAQLQQMTEEMSVELHPDHIEVLRVEFGHSIKVV